MGNTQIWMRIHLGYEREQEWDNYNNFRLKLNNSSGFGVCLEIGSDLPDEVRCLVRFKFDFQRILLEDG